MLLALHAVAPRPGPSVSGQGTVTKGPGLEGLPTLSRCKGETLQCLWFCCGCVFSFLFSVEAPSRLTTFQPPLSKIPGRSQAPRSRRAAAGCSVMDRPHDGPGRALYFCVLYIVQTVYSTSRRSRASSMFVHRTAVQHTHTAASHRLLKLLRGGRYLGRPALRARGIVPILYPLQTRQPVLAAGLFLPAPFAIPSRPRCWRPPGLWVRGSARTSTSTGNAPKHSARSRRRWER